MGRPSLPYVVVKEISLTLPSGSSLAGSSMKRGLSKEPALVLPSGLENSNLKTKTPLISIF